MAVLVGVEQIKSVLGNVSEGQIGKWRKEFESFPVKNLGGRLVSDSDALSRWFQAYCAGNLYLFDAINELTSKIEQIVDDRINEKMSGLKHPAQNQRKRGRPKKARQ